jgi:1,6-anhydro-N-acetylmuramate kinase
MGHMTSTIQFPAHVIGLMSGTSADGVDAAMLFTDGQTIAKAGESLFTPYDDALRADILATANEHLLGRLRHRTEG